METLRKKQLHYLQNQKNFIENLSNKLSLVFMSNWNLRGSKDRKGPSRVKKKMCKWKKIMHV